MKALIGLLLLTLSVTVYAEQVPCDFLDSEGQLLGRVLTKADSEAAAQVFAAQSELVILDGKLFVREGFDLSQALDGQIKPVHKIVCKEVDKDCQ